MAPKMKLLKPGRFVKVRSGEYYRLTTIGDVVVMETRLADIAVEVFYDENLQTVIRQNKMWDIMKVCNEQYSRYESSSGTGGSRLYYSR